MDLDQETSWENEGSEGNSQNAEGEVWAIINFNQPELKCSDADVNHKLNIQDFEIPKLTGVNRESSQHIDKGESHDEQQLLRVSTSSSLLKTTCSLCELNDSWEFLWSEIEEFINFGDEVLKDQNQIHLNSLAETEEVIITQLEKNIWTDSPNQLDITNFKIQGHTEMLKS